MQGIETPEQLVTPTADDGDTEMEAPKHSPTGVARLDKYEAEIDEYQTMRLGYRQ